MSGEQKNRNPRARDYIGIHFRCCNVYGRIYKTKKGDHYAGFCPRCMAQIRAKVGKDGQGTDQRIFQST